MFIMPYSLVEKYKKMWKFLFYLIFLSKIVNTCPADVSHFINSMQKAEHRLELITPGIFSTSVIKTLQELAAQQMRIRILTDCTFIEEAGNLLDMLYDTANIFIRIIPHKFAISHNILIIDEKTVVFGGSHLIDSATVFTKNMAFEQQDKSLAAEFQAIWIGIDPKQSALLQKDISFFLETDTVSVNNAPANHSKRTNETKQNSLQKPFAASKNSRVYHKSDSPSLKRIKKSNLIFFATEDEAKQSGRSPASNL